MLGTAPIGVLVADQSSQILYANQTLRQMLGYADGPSLVGQSLARLLPMGMENAHQHLLSRFFEEPRQRQMGVGKILHARRNDDALIPIEIALGPMHLEGRLVAIAYISDISARKRAQHHFEQIFGAMPLGLLAIDGAGTITQTNPALCQMFGYSAEALVGQPLHLLLPHRFRPMHGAYLQTYLAQPTTRLMGPDRTLTALHSGGQEFPVEIALTHLMDQHDPVILAIVNDISDLNTRKKTEADLRQNLEQLDVFNFAISHDLRTPLRGLSDLLTWIREDLQDRPLSHEIERNFQRADLRIRRLEYMIQDLLDYARAGDYSPKLEKFSFIQLITETLSLLDIPAYFSLELDMHDAEFNTSKAALSAVMRNLISNAIKHHGGTGGRIRIAMRAEARFNVIIVEDDGQGIPVGFETRIFRLFQRGKTTTEGQGMGLAVTRRIVNAHGGMIFLGAPGTLGGACFIVHWPRLPVAERNDD